jgi:hypothetical protein
MPVRFTAPSLGEDTTPQLKAHQWQIDFTYRNLPGGPFYVGTHANQSAAPFGQPLRLNINSLDVSVDYGVTDQFTVTLTMPFSGGTESRFYADDQRHEVGAAGLGDISFVGTMWLWNPTKHPNSNVSVGVGVKTPSGNNSVNDNFWLADGSVIRAPVDQAIELGDGGWGVIFQAQAYKKLFNRATGYGFGSYLLSPKDMTNIMSPYPGVTLSVPDVYSARGGMAYDLSPKRGISGSLGVRIDGIPIHDLIGGSDGYRRPGYSFYIDPGISYVHGRNTITLNVPVRVHQNFKKSIVDIQTDRLGGGDLTKFLILAEYSVRF